MENLILIVVWVRDVDTLGRNVKYVVSKDFQGPESNDAGKSNGWGDMLRSTRWRAVRRYLRLNRERARQLTI